MESTKTQHNWKPFIDLFSNTYRRRPTRIAVFEGFEDDLTDYWLEDGMPLNALDVDERYGKGISVEIMLGDEHSAKGHLTHVVEDARFFKIALSASGDADGLEIGDATGKTTVLRFEGN